MRDIPKGLQDALDSRVTTLARAWTITRQDGQRLGFTDHDRVLSFNDVSHESMSGLNAGSQERTAGFSVNTYTISGALTSESIRDDDLRNGLYDGAIVEFWLVDWSNLENRLLESVGTITETRQTPTGFEAEISGLSHALNRPTGRSYLRQCDRTLGDAGCRVNLTDPIFSTFGIVESAYSPHLFTVSGLDQFQSEWFSNGLLEWASGENLGSTSQIRMHRKTREIVEIGIWTPTTQIARNGDRFSITAGCNKTSAECRDKFSNLLNFGGFPFMPGDDWVVGYPNDGGGHDGTSLFRG